MKASIFIAMVAFASISTAHELDEQPLSGNDTTIVRISKADPTQVEVAHVSKRLAKGEVASNLNFTQMAMKAEPRNVPTERANELDATSSTNSWRVWGGRGYYGNNFYGGAYVAGGYRGYGYNNYGYNNYGYAGGYYNPYYGSNYYRAAYYQNYYYTPYYGYQDQYYSYQYYNCPQYYY